MSGTKRLMRPTPEEWEKLGNFTLASSSLMEYTSIPQTYTHLKVIGAMQSNRAGFQNTGMRMQINGVSTSWYNFSASYKADVNGSGAPIGSTSRLLSSWYLGQAPAGSRTSNDLTAMVEVLLPFYRAANYSRNYSFQSGGDDGTNVLYASGGGAFVQTAAAISSIQVKDDVGGALGPRMFAELWAA